MASLIWVIPVASALIAMIGVITNPRERPFAGVVVVLLILIIAGVSIYQNHQNRDEVNERDNQIRGLDDQIRGLNNKIDGLTDQLGEFMAQLEGLEDDVSEENRPALIAVQRDAIRVLKTVGTSKALSIVNRYEDAIGIIQP